VDLTFKTDENFIKLENSGILSYKKW